ncbi:alpha/beta-Hydrolase [Glarea lozoyensis ATCC 20868]|uniref:Alpha/beta-Hydrolase n=1 Tax=Glarea lozoyensis (strain ATCC 20868 / MF5171) TaxID=1116229 RepID=S3DDQ4_GLAL2|nr:alpha/beta-Hydrolase [Glarea lozoyensis ATCC 20868]EPE35860.1 alpha/beta-Hydrolase [Glarea lozoyensis ATCC 20868]
MSVTETHAKADKATILLVQGSFQTPLVYTSLVQRLLKLDYPTIHPSLPSCTNVDDPEFPSITLVDDALAVRLELIRQIEYKGNTVVVAMHSYGGLVGSEAIPEELAYSYRKSRGLSGGVIHLYYFSAFILPPGKSVLGAFGESPNNDVKPDGRFGILNGASILYNDLPESDAKLWESRLIPQSYAVQKTELTRGAYKYIPSTYLICENDKAAPTQYQEMFAASAGAHIERCNAGHSAMLSQTKMLADKISDAVETAIAKETPEGT